MRNLRWDKRAQRTYLLVWKLSIGFLGYVLTFNEREDELSMKTQCTCLCYFVQEPLTQNRLRWPQGWKVHCSLITLAVNRQQIIFSLNFTCRRQNPGRGISLLTASVNHYRDEREMPSMALNGEQRLLYCTIWIWVRSLSTYIFARPC